MGRTGCVWAEAWRVTRHGAMSYCATEAAILAGGFLDEKEVNIDGEGVARS